MMNHLELLAALTADYLNVFVARPGQDSADIIKLKGYVTKGITDVPQGFQYSKLLRTYAEDRVYAPDREYFLQTLSPQAVIEAFSDGRDRLEYTYRIKDTDGSVHKYAARYSRISSSNEELRLVVAFRNIDFIDAVGREKREEGLRSAYQAISGIFFSMHRVNVQDNTYSVIKNTPTIEKLAIPGSDCYDTNADRIIRGVSSKWSLEDALRFVDRSTLPQRMEGKNHIIMEFLSYASETCNLHFFREDEDDEGKLLHVIFAVEKVDEQKSRAIINALSRDFRNVFLVDLDDGTSRVLKMRGFIWGGANGNQNQKFPYESVLSEYIATRVHPEDREMMQKAISLDHLREVFKEKDELSGSYRILSDGEVHHFRYTVYKLANLNSVVAGFSNIDAVIARHTEEEERQREKEAAYQRQQEEQLAIFNTLARNFKNVYMVDLEKATAKVLKLEDEFTDHRLDGVMGVEFPYEKLLGAWIDEAVIPDDREMLRQALSVVKLREVFATKKEYTGNYRMMGDGRLVNYQFSVSMMHDGIHLIAGFQNVDAIIKAHLEEEKRQREKEQAYQNLLQEQLMVLNTLARGFKKVYLVDLERETAKILKQSQENGAESAEVGSEFPFEEVRSFWLNHVVCPGDRQEVEKTFEPENIRRLLLSQKEFAGNYRSIVGGELHHFRYSMCRVGESGLQAVFGYQNIDKIVEEHHEQEKKERELEEAKRKHTEVISSLSTIYSAIISVELGTHRYEVLTSIPRMDSVTGKSGNLDDVIEKILSVFMIPEMKDAMRKFLNLNTLAERLKRKNTISAEYKNPHGTWIEARFIVKRRDENGVVEEVLYVARDINYRKLHEIEQQEKLKNQLGVINSLAREYAVLCLVDGKSGEWSVFKTGKVDGGMSVVRNESDFGNYDASMDTFVDKYVAEEDRAPLKERMKLESLLSETPDAGVNSVYYDCIKDHRRLHCQANTAKFTTDSGKVYIVVGFRDIHEAVEKQVKQQEQLSQALAAAQQASKAKSTFLNSMSHDIRTPMNAIIGFTALAQTHIDNQEQVKDYLEKINTSSTHLLSLINDILDMSRIESGTVKLDEKPIHIPDLLHDLRTMIQDLVNSKNQNLYIDTQDVVHEDVIADKLRLNQVMINIVGNAIKYTPEGGDIIIHLAEKPCSMQHYRTYVFTVKDTGIGMSKKFMAHIFETFTRERSSTVSGVQGTGLGMAITKNIVDMMGGEITAQSELGKGSTFTVTLHLKLANEQVRTTPIPTLLGARVLVVDDDLDTCRSVSKMLRDIKMRPDWTVSGKEAIIRAQEAEETNDEYKVYIIDYLMPDMNGIETVRRIRGVIGDEIPIIVLTAYDWDEIEHEAREAGVTAFMSKPLFISELRKVLAPQEDEEREEQKEPGHFDYRGKHVLLVEDNELNREIATAILEEMGIKVDSVTDGEEAVDAMYKADENEYDLIFMDIQMPKMDGYTATHEIRTFANNRKANIPIIAMTANAFEEDRKKSLEAGMNGHISKPININEIARVLDTIFA